MLNPFILSTYLFKFFLSLKFFILNPNMGRVLRRISQNLYTVKNGTGLFLRNLPPKLFASLHPPSRPSIFKNSFVKYVFFSNMLLSDKKIYIN